MPNEEWLISLNKKFGELKAWQANIQDQQRYLGAPLAIEDCS